MSSNNAMIERLDVRTSSRRVFRRCLRKWGFSSSFRQNLQHQGNETNINFWFGTAIHFAMEDYFGYNRFGDPRRAFKAYYDAFKGKEKPDAADGHYDLGIAMLQYFLEWYPIHNSDMGFVTPWVNPETREEMEPWAEGAVPAVEQDFTLDLGIRVLIDVTTGQVIKELEATDVVINSSSGEGVPVGVLDEVDPTTVCSLIKGHCNAKYFRNDEPIPVRIVPVCYHGTMDRICKDRYGRWWILDYKTAKGADTAKLDTDDQISAYMWAAEQVFHRKFYGFIYLQLTKDVAKPPKELKNGDISTDKKQKTTRALYKQALIDRYGSVNSAPAKNIDTLNHLASLEAPEGDRFIRWDFVLRNDEQKKATYEHIMGEAHAMCDSLLYLYPNPTRDCGWDCPFREMCIAIDKGDEDLAQSILDSEFEVRSSSLEHNIDAWREDIKWPENDADLEALDKVEISDQGLFNLILPAEYLQGGDE